MKAFQRVYIEISNICNLQCTFCPEVERDKFVMKTQDFEKVLKEVAPYTSEICLHLMGEPLTHPQFKEILRLCREHNMPIQLTTNGTLLSQYGFDTFFKSTIRQINFSLHSFKDNFPTRDWKPYLHDILAFSKAALTEKPELYINYRLWNLPTPTETQSANQDMIDEICGYFQVAINERLDVAHRRSKNITGRVYFHFDTRFDWPSLSSSVISEKGFCHALSQHIGIHANGVVVACCLDKEAGNNLGNVFEQSFESILASEGLQKLQKGFQTGELLSPLCQRCSFIKRFKKAPLSESHPSAPTEK